MPSSESIVCVCPSVVGTEIVVTGSGIMGISVSTMPNGNVYSVIIWYWQMYIGGWAPSSRCRRRRLFPAFARHQLWLNALKVCLNKPAVMSMASRQHVRCPADLASSLQAGLMHCVAVSCCLRSATPQPRP